MLIKPTLTILGLLNVVSFLTYVIDKSRARRDKRRISEARLLQFTFIGPFGSIPGIWWARHKTRKISYLAKYVAVVVASLVGHLSVLYYAFLSP